MKNPYRRMSRGGKNVFVHRYVMEQSLGRPLRPDEVVHHRDGDKHNNSIENLEIMTPREHGLEHFPPKHPVTKECVICGNEFTPVKKHRQRQQTCGRLCGDGLICLKRFGPDSLEEWSLRNGVSLIPPDWTKLLAQLPEWPDQ